jgi:hypothetical protein
MDDEKIFKHPAYGMIGISQCTGTMTLVGSAVKHQHFLSLKIKEAERHYDLNHEHWFGRKTICEIFLSHAQLAEMLFSLNRGEGVPCTIRYAIGDATSYRENPPYESPFKEATNDLVTSISSIMSTAEELAKEAETILTKPTITKADRKKLTWLTKCIQEHVNNHVKFAAKSVDEKMEKVEAHAKAEIETFIDMKFRLAGIEAYKQQVVSLPDNKKEEALDE